MTTVLLIGDLQPYSLSGLTYMELENEYQGSGLHTCVTDPNKTLNPKAL